jgi:hypothetical protein
MLDTVLVSITHINQNQMREDEDAIANGAVRQYPVIIGMLVLHLLGFFRLNFSVCFMANSRRLPIESKGSTSVGLRSTCGMGCKGR